MPQQPVPLQSTARGWVVCMTASLCFFYIFVLMTIFNTINPNLMQAFSISADKLGELSGAYFYTHCLLVFPAGLLLDRFATKKILVSVMFICVISMGLFAFTSSFELAFLYRMLMGVSGAFGLVSCLRLASRWFPPQKLALISGMMITTGFLGGVVSQTPLTLLVGSIGWRLALLVISGLGLLIIVINILLVKDYPVGHKPIVCVDKSGSFDCLWNSIKNAVTSYHNWLFGLFTSLVNLPLWILGAVWGSTFLIQAQHFSKDQASYITSMLFLGAVVGSPLFGWLSDRMQNRRWPMILGALASLLVILLIMYLSGLNLYEQMLLFFILGVVTSAQVISYPAITESNQPAYIGGAQGLASALIIGAGFIFPPLFGWIMDLHWDHTKYHNIAVYSLQNYQLALWMLPIAFVVSIIIAFVVKETYQKT